MVDLTQIKIVKAADMDYDILTEISFAAKRHWNYPESYFDIWKEELTITRDYITQNIVEIKSDFYSGKTFVKKGFWLEHIYQTRLS